MNLTTCFKSIIEGVFIEKTSEVTYSYKISVLIKYIL